VRRAVAQERAAAVLGEAVGTVVPAGVVEATVVEMAGPSHPAHNVHRFEPNQAASEVVARGVTEGGGSMVPGQPGRCGQRKTRRGARAGTSEINVRAGAQAKR